MARKKASRTAKAFWCTRCATNIRVPRGWGAGSASRRHYWAKHPEVMRPKLGRGR